MNTLSKSTTSTTGKKIYYKFIMRNRSLIDDQENVCLCGLTTGGLRGDDTEEDDEGEEEYQDDDEDIDNDSNRLAVAGQNNS